MDDHQDIASVGNRDWLAVGWFTPDYRPLAARFANNLAQHAIPYHLFARDKIGNGWDTRQKPSVVLEAMKRYPGRTVVLMDVDCIVKDDIEPITRITTDIAVSVKARQLRKGRAWQKQIAVVVGSRVAVFRPTNGARTFLQEWERQCRGAHYSGDETSMAWAYLLRPEVTSTQLDRRFAGSEVTAAPIPGLVVAHESVHDRSTGHSISLFLRSLEKRYLRTGRTKAHMAQKTTIG